MTDYERMKSKITKIENMAYPELCAMFAELFNGAACPTPMIFPDDSVLEIRNVCQREKMLYLTVDGRTNCELYRGETVRITRSALETRLVRLKTCGFYDRLRMKMSEHN